MGAKKQAELELRIESSTAEKDVRPNQSTGIARQGEIDSVLLDIYKLTGQTVTRDDPILLAALFQSRLIERAGDTASRSISEAAEKTNAALTEAVNIGNDRAAALDRSIAIAFQQIADGAKRMGDDELATLQARFARMASETLEKVRHEAARNTPTNAKWRTGVVVIIGVLAGMTAGIWLARYSAPVFSSDQIRLIHNGQLLDDAWSKLPRESREILAPVPLSKAPATQTASAGVTKK